MGRVRLYTHLVVILCILSFQAFAQIGSATITGTVTDPTGAAVLPSPSNSGRLQTLPHALVAGR